MAWLLVLPVCITYAACIQTNDFTALWPNLACCVSAVLDCMRANPQQHVEEPSLLATAQGATQPLQQQQQQPCPKPPPGSSQADKARYITDKYMGHKYVAAPGQGLSRESAQALLWDSVDKHNIG